MSDRWKSRKFWAVMGWTAVATVMLWHGKIGEDTWETVIIFLIPAYVTSNVAQRVLSKPKEDAV